MKKNILTLVCLISLAFAAQAAVTINFNLGAMYSGATTNTPTFPAGAVINLLALDSGTWAGQGDLKTLFGNLTNSFVPTGATLVGTIYNDNVAGPGVTGGAYTYSYSGNFGEGDQLLAVAYPTLTSLSTAPGLNTPGFYFRSDIIDITDGSDISWIAPANGGTYTLAAVTLDYAGSFPNGQFTSGAASAAANGATYIGGGFTTVPEPSTYALLAMSGIGMAGYVIRRRRRA